MSIPQSLLNEIEDRREKGVSRSAYTREALAIRHLLEERDELDELLTEARAIHDYLPEPDA